VPTETGDFKPEPEMERLSQIVQTFNELWGNIDWKDEEKIVHLLTEEIPQKVAADEAYQNAVKHADRQNARIEHDRALQKVLLSLLTDHTELYKLFSDNDSFRKWLADTIFFLTYDNPAATAG
jgi:type I restriction enzyme R subunit